MCTPPPPPHVLLGLTLPEVNIVIQFNLSKETLLSFWPTFWDESSFANIFQCTEFPTPSCTSQNNCSRRKEVEVKGSYKIRWKIRCVIKYEPNITLPYLIEQIQSLSQSVYLQFFPLASKFIVRQERYFWKEQYDGKGGKIVWHGLTHCQSDSTRAISSIVILLLWLLSCVRFPQCACFVSLCVQILLRCACVFFVSMCVCFVSVCVCLPGSDTDGSH